MMTTSLSVHSHPSIHPITVCVCVMITASLSVHSHPSIHPITVCGNVKSPLNLHPTDVPVLIHSLSLFLAYIISHIMYKHKTVPF